MNPIQSSVELARINENEFDDQQKVVVLSQLPKTKGFLGLSSLSLYQGFWCPSKIVPNVISFQTHFQAHDQDIILASKPKSGTTWLKALVFSIVNRARYTPSNTPLLISNPHQLVPFLEFTLFADHAIHKNSAAVKVPDLSGIPSPRLFSTHIPYPSLPESVKNSKCRIVYICRNPLDVIVSSWHFGTQDRTRSQWTNMEEYVDKFWKGEAAFGPFWDHVLSYWRESLEKPEKVLFLRYEDMKEDTVAQVKRIAEFVGFRFSDEEESGGVVRQISEMCSLKSLKDLEVNKTGKFMPNFENKSYFRKGGVGDWVNHLSASLAKRIISKVNEEKLKGSGLTFKYES